MKIPGGRYKLTPLRITLAYGAFGLAWILWSDYLLLNTVESAAVRTTMQTLKGGLFVVVSGAIIWALTDRREQQLQAIRSRLERMNQHHTVLHRLFRHDIRNEMNVIKGNVDLVRHAPADYPAGDHLDVASERADTVLEISEKLKILDQYEIEGEGIEETVDITRVVGTELDQLAAAHPEAMIDTDMPPRAMFVGDCSLAYIFQELFGNAAEHFDGPVADLELSVEVEKRRGRVAVSIQDNGPGISEGDVMALDEGKESSLVHLSGVGLWIAHWLTDRANATMAIEGDAERGTSIDLEFTKPGTIPNVGLVGEENLGVEMPT